jgi:hypothetical protein
VSETRTDLYARLQAESPVSIRFEAVPLPGGYSLLEDEFLARSAKDWGMSSQPVMLTTQRLIFSAAQGASVIRLADITNVTYKKSFVGFASVVVDVAGGGHIILPAHINGEQVTRDIAAMVEFARRSAQGDS